MEPKLVRDLMTREVTTLERNDQLSLADAVMSLGRIRHMPVLDEDGKLAGIVSQRDLFRGALANALGYGTRAQSKILDSLLVKDVMTEDVLTTTPESSVAEAAELMVTRKVGCLPVLEGDELVGIVTEADFVTLFAER